MVCLIDLWFVHPQFFHVGYSVAPGSIHGNALPFDQSWYFGALNCLDTLEPWNLTYAPQEQGIDEWCCRYCNSVRGRCHRSCNESNIYTCPKWGNRRAHYCRNSAATSCCTVQSSRLKKHRSPPPLSFTPRFSHTPLNIPVPAVWFVHPPCSTGWINHLADESPPASHLIAPLHDADDATNGPTVRCID